ncbi:MAG TPA: RNA methyltransferase [Rectinemataceae bacterium]|nr:RNA methyltransferase [Rectinemataceae bacterium]
MIPPWLSRLGSLRDRDLAAEGLVVAEGRLVAQRLAARSDFVPLALLATPETATAFEGPGFESWPLFISSEAELSTFAGFPFHRGVIALAKRPSPASVAAFAASLEAKALPPLLVLPQTRDPENLGALARSAAVFGFGALLVGRACPDFLSRRTLRVSMGAVLDLPMLRLDSSADWRTFSERGYRLAGAVIDPGASDAATWEVRQPAALALGDEYAGLDDDWLALCDEKITITMAAGPDSLNVAAAGAILMWRVAEGRRERGRIASREASGPT